MDWLRKAIREHGGFRVVATLSGISEPHLYSICRKPGMAGARPLTRAVAQQLAPVLTRVPRQQWRDALLGDLFTKKRRRTAASADDAVDTSTTEASA